MTVPHGHRSPLSSRLATIVRRAGATWTELEVRAGERARLGDELAFDVSELYEVVEGL